MNSVNFTINFSVIIMYLPHISEEYNVNLYNIITLEFVIVAKMFSEVKA